MLDNDEYTDKFCKVFIDAINQTDPIAEHESMETIEESSRNVNASSVFNNQQKNPGLSRAKTNITSKTTLYFGGNNPSRQAAEPKTSARSKQRVSAEKSEDRSVQHHRSSKLNASQRTRSQMMEGGGGDHSSQLSRGKASSSKHGSVIKGHLYNHPASSNKNNHFKRYYDVGITCDLMQNYQEEGAKLNNSTLPTSTKR